MKLFEFNHREFVDFDKTTPSWGAHFISTDIDDFCFKVQLIFDWFKQHPDTTILKRKVFLELVKEKQQQKDAPDDEKTSAADIKKEYLKEIKHLEDHFPIFTYQQRLRDLRDEVAKLDANEQAEVVKNLREDVDKIEKQQNGFKLLDENKQLKKYKESLDECLKVHERRLKELQEEVLKQESEVLKEESEVVKGLREEVDMFKKDYCKVLSENKKLKKDKERGEKVLNELKKGYQRELDQNKNLNEWIKELKEQFIKKL